MAILDYEQVWSSLGYLGHQVKAERELDARIADGNKKMAEPMKGVGKGGKGEKGEKVEKTDKVLIGKKTSWAVANALGEVGRMRLFSERLTDDRRKTLKTEGQWWRTLRQRRMLCVLCLGLLTLLNAAVQTEVEGFRQCHIRDGAALVRFFAWLEECLHRGEKWSEYDAAQVLEKYRRCIYHIDLLMTDEDCSQTEQALHGAFVRDIFLDWAERGLAGESVPS